MKTNTIAIISANYDLDGFGELTKKRAAATVPFGGRYRLIDFALSNLVNSGITSIGVIAPYYYRSMLDHIGDGKNWGLAKKKGGMFILPGSIYGERSKKGRFLIKDLSRNRQFFEKEKKDYVLLTGISRVSNFDYTPFIEAHEKSGAKITLMYSDRENGPDDGMYVNIDENGRLINFSNKGEGSVHLYNGVLIFDREYLLTIIDSYKNLEQTDLVEIIRNHPEKFDINTYKKDGYEAIVHSLKDYVKANMDLLNPEVRKELFETDRQIITKVQDEPPTIYKEGSLVRNSLIAAGCKIEGTVENSIIFRAVTIKKGAVIKNSIIMQNCIIEKDAKIEYAVLDKYVTAKEGHCILGTEDNPAIVGKSREL